jgi:hypothetical protein
MTRSAVSVWKKSFLNVPDPSPPECPGDRLNEPQYAELLYGKACTVSRPILSFNLNWIINFFSLVLWKERGEDTQNVGGSSEGVHQLLGCTVRSSRIIHDWTPLLTLPVF